MKLKIIFFIAFFASTSALWAKSEPKQPDTYAYTRGIEAYNAEEYNDALDWFNRELSEHPDNGYAFVYISILRYGNNEYGKSLSAINNALKHLPKKDKKWRSKAYATRAEVHAALEDTVKAFDDLTEAIKTNPSDRQFYNRRAQLHYEQKNYALADADYQKMVELDGGDTMGYMGLGRNANVREQWDDAISRFDHVIKLAPDYSPGYSFRAEAYMGQKKWTEAADDIIKALDIDGDDKAFYLMGIWPKDVLDLMKSKLKIQMTKQPTNAYWPYCIANLAQYNGDYDDAISYYEKAHAIDANSVFLENTAECYMDKDELDLALDYAERALAMSPEDYDVIDLKAGILRTLGRYDECLVERDRYVAHYPEYSLAYFRRAEERLEAGRFSDAIEDYNTAIVLDPDLAGRAFILMRRGDAYRFLGKNDEARKDYEALLAVEKDSTLTTDSWTPFAYTGLGDAEKAIETMQTIIATDTTDITGTLYNAACIYARLGRKTEAMKYLKEAVEKGYNRFSHIATDYDLDCLRDMPEYQEIISLRPAAKAAEGGTTDQGKDLSLHTTEIVEVPFTKEGGVTKVKCTINELPLHFVFDTGAADVTMSMVEANFMLKNDYIKPSDIMGSARYIDANGDITEGTIINLRSVNFGGLELDNVRASVVRNQKAPLLLGQSVLGRLGKIEIDNPAQKLVITHKVSK